VTNNIPGECGILGHYRTMAKADEAIAEQDEAMCSTYGCLNPRKPHLRFYQCGDCASACDPEVWRIQARDPSNPKSRWSGKRVEYNWEEVVADAREVILNASSDGIGACRLKLMRDIEYIKAGK